MRDDIQQYIWDSLNELSYLFPKSLTQKLQSLKETENRDEFLQQLEIAFDFEPGKYQLIQELYTDYIINTPDSLSSYIKLLDESLFVSFNKRIEFVEKAKHFIQSIDTETLELAFLYESLAHYSNILGNYNESKILYEKALKIHLETVGENHANTARSYDGLGDVYDYLMESQKAKEYILKALNIRLSILGENHLETAKSYVNLGFLHNSLEEFQKSEEYFIKALNIRLQILGENHLETAMVLHGLGSLYSKLKDYSKAEEYLKKALDIRLQILGENHPLTAKTIHGLGYISYSIKSYEKAEEYLKKALDIRLQTLGENNYYVALTYNSLGYLYNSLERYEEAKDFLIKENYIYLEKYNNYYQDIVNNYAALSFTHRLLDDYVIAQEYDEKILRIQREMLQEDQIGIANTYNNLGVNLSHLNKPIEANIFFKNAFQISVQKLGISNSDTELYYSNIILQTNELKQSFFIDTKNSSIEPIIKSIHITDFKLLEDICIDFTTNINIVIGANSSGKTSLLQAISLALLQENYIGESNEKYENCISKEKKEATVKLVTSQGYSKEVTIKKDKRKITGKVFSPFVLAYCSNIFSKDAIEVNDIVNEMIEGKIRKDFANSIFEDYTNQYYNPKSILNKLSQLKHEFEEIIVDTINDFLDDFNLIKDVDTRYYFKHKNEKNYRLEELSEGYRNTIVLIGDMVVKILGIGERPETVEGIILIDEFDRHLHPKIQTNLVSKLTKHFPKIQFILTTHNPMAVLDRKQEELIVLYEENGTIIGKKGIGTESIDVGTVLLKYFDVDSLVGATMEINIERSVELQLKDDLTVNEKEELSFLKTTLSDTVASNFIYNKAYYNFLLFLKKYPELEYKEFKKLDDKRMVELMEQWKQAND